jgi:hypothetical protein
VVSEARHAPGARARTPSSATAGAGEKNDMKALLTTLAGLLIATFAGTASAHVVTITTSIPVSKAANDVELRAAVESAIDDAVRRAISFTPTAVTLETVRRVSDRIYLVLLVLDEDGEELMKQLETDEANDSDEVLPEPRANEVRSL